VTRRKLRPSEQAIIDKLASIHRGPVADLFVAQQDILSALQKNRRNTATGLIYHYTGTGGLEALKQVKIGPAQKEKRGRRIVAKVLRRAGLSADIAMSTMPLVKH
jgi:hypothetical protein